jgi:hypothetical protein
MAGMGMMAGEPLPRAYRRQQRLVCRSRACSPRRSQSAPVACQLGTHWIGGEVIVYLLRYPDRSTEHRACNRSEVQPTEEATQAAAERSGDRPGAAGHPAPPSR